MKTELVYLVCVTLLTALMWIPYILDRLAVRGIPDTMGYPQSPKPQSAWAQRMLKAHANAVENLVLFAPLVIILHLLNISNGLTITACVLYFSSRLAHAVIYTWGVPLFRTLSFLASWAGLIILVLSIFRIV